MKCPYQCQHKDYSDNCKAPVCLNPEHNWHLSKESYCPVCGQKLKTYDEWLKERGEEDETD